MVHPAAGLVVLLGRVEALGHTSTVTLLRRWVLGVASVLLRVPVDLVALQALFSALLASPFRVESHLSLRVMAALAFSLVALHLVVLARALKALVAGALEEKVAPAVVHGRADCSWLAVKPSRFFFQSVCVLTCEKVYVYMLFFSMKM